MHSVPSSSSLPPAAESEEAVSPPSERLTLNQQPEAAKETDYLISGDAFEDYGQGEYMITGDDPVVTEVLATE